VDRVEEERRLTVAEFRGTHEENRGGEGKRVSMGNMKKRKGGTSNPDLLVEERRKSGRVFSRSRRKREKSRKALT